MKQTQLTCESFAVSVGGVKNLARHLSFIEDPVLTPNILVENTELLTLQSCVQLTIGRRQSKVLTFIDTLFSEEGVTPMIHTIDTLIHTLKRTASNHSALISVVSIKDGAGPIQEEEELAVSIVVAGGLAGLLVRDPVTLPDDMTREVAVRDGEVVAPVLTNNTGDHTQEDNQPGLEHNHIVMLFQCVSRYRTFTLEW